MTSTKQLRMDADTFVAWAMEQGEGRFELAAGEVVAMAPERAAHNRVKGRVFQALQRAISESALACEAFTDGMVVRVDDSTVYEPDATLRCGQPLADDATEVSDPLSAPLCSGSHRQPAGHSSHPRRPQRNQDFDCQRRRLAIRSARSRGTAGIIVP
ncbi:MAG: Uma2 family endonuclease [Myxococcota bacterium]